MSNQRDELATVIAETYLNNLGVGPLAPKLTNNDLAEAILEAGWRPPARTISARVEFEALPDRSIILTEDGDYFEKDGKSWWTPGSKVDFNTTPTRPATVIYEPKG
jgi:hypothetical protein